MAILPRHRPASLWRPTLDRVLCAVDATRGGTAAVREALVLAPCATRLSFIAVNDDAGDGRAAVVSLAARRARQALEQAQAKAAARSIRADVELLDAADAAGALIERARAGTILVVGGHGEHPAGRASGPVATPLAARAAGPLLVARAGARADATGLRILVAVDDSAGAAALAELAGAIAASCAGVVHLVHIQNRDYGSQTRHRLAELATTLIEQTGSEPVVDVARAANVAAHVCQLARDCDTSLVVVGRRSRPGAPALGPVGQRIVLAAPCSVLVAPTA